MQQVVDWLGGDKFDGCLIFDEWCGGGAALQGSMQLGKSLQPGRELP